MEMLNKKMGGAFAFKKEANMNVPRKKTLQSILLPAG